MAKTEIILKLDNKIEALLLADILKDRKIPFYMKSYEDLAYDGLFQMNLGWGHIEAEPVYRSEIEEIYNDIKTQRD